MENWVSESEHKEDETQGDGRERERCLLRGIYRKFLAGEDETVFLEQKEELSEETEKNTF